MAPSTPPTGLKALRDRRVLEITWADGRVDAISLHKLRCECPCAGCVDEFTGERTLIVEAVPQDIAPAKIDFAGNYALRIVWSDGHSTGLYTWDRLARIARENS